MSLPQYHELKATGVTSFPGLFSVFILYYLHIQISLVLPNKSKNNECRAFIPTIWMRELRVKDSRFFLDFT
jgi:hypothetical protein